MPEIGTAPTPASDDAGLARVLQPLLEQSFVLTDRDGFVTRWTPRAQSLFGHEDSAVTGHSLLETLAASEQAAPDAGVLDVTVRHDDGQEFPVELTYIPVPMSKSLEFNGFLEALESDRPREAVLRRVQSQHADVLGWIGDVAGGNGDALKSDEMTAGTIVAFRAKADTPWTDMPAPAPGQNGSPPPQRSAANPQLVNAVDRAGEMAARSDALEKNMGEATAAVEEARTKADAAHETAAAAASRVAELDDENVALRTELESAANELAEVRRTLEASAESGADQAALAELRTELEGLRAAGEAAGAEEISALREELQALRNAAPTAGSDELDALRSELETLREATRTDGAAEGKELARLRGELEYLRAQAPAVEEVASLRNELEALRTGDSRDEELTQLRTELEQLRTDSDASSAKDLEELRAELAELRESTPAIADTIDIHRLKEDLEELRESAPDAAVDVQELHRLRRELDELRAEAPAGSDFEALRSELAELKAQPPVTNAEELEELRAELRALRKEAPSAGIGIQEFELLREELAAARAQAADAAERVRQLHSAGGAGDTVSGEMVERAEAALADARELAEALRAQLEEARESVAEDVRKAAEAAAEADGHKREADNARKDAEGAMRSTEHSGERAAEAVESSKRHLAETREAVEGASVESKVARAQAEAARAAAEEAARYVEIARELAEAMTAGAEGAEEDNRIGPAPLLAKKEQKTRPPIPGFDDADHPMATIDLDGRFRELNTGFSELVGYGETDFQSASWPPIADRRQIDHHREQMTAMLAGDLSRVEVDTGYVHAMGLLVPVAGVLELMRDEAGKPTHFVLDVTPATRAAAA